MFGNAPNNNRQSRPIDQEESTSFLSDIKNFIGSISYKGGIGAGGISNQNNEALKNQYQQGIRNIYNRIDDLLKKECFFCGSLLIDMIDSGIVRADKYNEFADSGISMKTSSTPLLGNDEEEDDPWAIE